METIKMECTKDTENKHFIMDLMNTKAGMVIGTLLSAVLFVGGKVFT